MSLLFCDGFGHYTTPLIQAKWDNEFLPGIPGVIDINPSAGRIFDGCLELQPSATNEVQLIKNLPGSYSQIICGFGYMVKSLPVTNKAWNVLVFSDTGVDQGGLVVDTNGRLCWGVSTARIGVDSNINVFANQLTPKTPGGLIQPNQWVHIGVNAIFSPGGAGTILLYIDGRLKATINTATTSYTSGTVNQILLTSPYYSNVATLAQLIASFDDFYVMDTSGTNNNTFIGDRFVYYDGVSGNGSVTDFAHTGAASNWQAIADNPPDDDTSYISDGTIGHSNLSTMATLPTTITGIDAGQRVMYARKTDASSRFIDGLSAAGAGTPVVDGASHSLTTTYKFNLTPLDHYPVDGSNWTVPLANAMQAGVRITAS